MKKTLLLLLICAFSTGAFAQKTLVKASLLSPLVRTGSFFVEHAFSAESSAQLGFLYTGFSVDQTSYAGFAITPEYRFYLSETPAPAGFFVAPYLRYQNNKLTEDTSNSEATLSGIGGGLLIGKQWIFKERVSLEMFAGPSYTNASIEVTSGTEDDFSVSGAFDGFSVRAGITLGLGF